MGLLQLARFTGSHVDLGISRFKAIAFKVRGVDLGRVWIAAPSPPENLPQSLKPQTFKPL